MSGAVLIALGALAHAVAGRWVASPWQLPDLTLVGVCLAASHPSASLLEVIFFAAFLPMLASWGSGWAAGIGYAVAAAWWRWAGSHWDLTQQRLSA